MLSSGHILIRPESFLAIKIKIHFRALFIKKKPCAQQKDLNTRKIFWNRGRCPWALFSKDALCPVKIFGTYKTEVFFSKDALYPANIFEYYKNILE